jgi:hypothetical protein
VIAPTLPKPMTPGLARRLARRWGWAAFAPVLPALVLASLPDPFDAFRMPLYAVAFLCGVKWASWASWADGFEAADRRDGGAS